MLWPVCLYCVNANLYLDKHTSDFPPGSRKLNSLVLKATAKSLYGCCVNPRRRMHHTEKVGILQFMSSISNYILAWKKSLSTGNKRPSSPLLPIWPKSLHQAQPIFCTKEMGVTLMGTITHPFCFSLRKCVQVTMQTVCCFTLHPHTLNYFYSRISAEWKGSTARRWALICLSR